MAIKSINTTIVLRNDTAENWTTNNPTLKSGEIGIESNTRRFKIGDGSSTWNSLEYSGEYKSSIYEHTKASTEETDDASINAALNGATAVKDDICIITTNINSEFNEKSAFIYDGTKWTSMNGNVDANKVILRDNITMAGNYTQVGNLTKTSNGTATFSTKGKSVADALTEIFSKRLQPTKTEPLVAVSLTGAGAYEVGTKVSISYKATITAGSYTYGPATGITAQSWAISDTDSHTSTSSTGTFDTITVGDTTNYKVTAVATHNEGTVAVDNLGTASDPEVKITAASKTGTSSAITGYRSFFYGVVDSPSSTSLTSTIIRGLTNGKKYDNTKTFTINATSTAKRIVIAIPTASLTSTRKGLKEAILTTAFNQPITTSYTHTTQAVMVEGSNGYTAVNYDVWVYEPSIIDAGEIHKITLY